MATNFQIVRNKTPKLPFCNSLGSWRIVIMKWMQRK